MKRRTEPHKISKFLRIQALLTLRHQGPTKRPKFGDRHNAGALPGLASGVDTESKTEW